MKRKSYRISEANFEALNSFGSNSRIKTPDDYMAALEYGETEVKRYLGQIAQPLTTENWEKVHGKLYGEIFGASGEFRPDYDSEQIEAFVERIEGMNPPAPEPGSPELSEGEIRQQEMELIAEQHLALLKEKPFDFGNEEMANLITEHRMELAFGEHPWQGLDQVDYQSWNQAIERGDAKVMAGLLENQIRDALSFGRDPLHEYQQERKEKPTWKERRQEKRETKEADQLAKQRMEDRKKEGDLIREKAKNEKPVDLSQESMTGESEREEQKAQEKLETQRRAAEIRADLARSREQKDQEKERER